MLIDLTQAVILLYGMKDRQYELHKGYIKSPGRTKKCKKCKDKLYCLTNLKQVDAILDRKGHHTFCA